ncbi:cell division cycle 6 [Musca autumnalis]|uniref:cell division cycle 6 n=1 Tax=Musca autumnalis TaxID=221902 RepID=UPI003CF0141C
MAVRRSTRLSSIGLKPATPTPTTSTTTKAPNTRRSNIWGHRQSTHSIHSDEEEEERSSNCSNEENCDRINQMAAHRKRTTTKSSSKSLDTVEAEDVPKTPKSKNALKPMPASKKRELLKRLQAEEENPIDQAQNEASPPKQPRHPQPSKVLPNHLISPSRLLDRLSIDDKPGDLSDASVEDGHGQKSHKKKSTIKEETPKKSPATHNKKQSARRTLNNEEEDLTGHLSDVSMGDGHAPKSHKKKPITKEETPKKSPATQNKKQTARKTLNSVEDLTGHLSDASTEDDNTQRSHKKKSIIKEETPKKSPAPRNKYQNARRVLNSAECQKLPGREEQLAELTAFFREHLENKKSGSLYVSGQPGTGKTACLSLLLRSPEFSHRIQKVYVNCTSIASIGGVYKKLCAELNLKPHGRTERDHLMALQEHIRTSSRMLLIVLDEIDQLCSSKQSVLYTIFEWPAMPDARILLVGIANSLDLTERTLLRLNARCELKPKHMHFPPYSKLQIVDIFKSRLEEAEVLDIFPPVTLQLLAAKVSAVSGDVRRALDIGRRVVEIAEQQKKAGEKEVQLKNLNNIVGESGESSQEPKEEVLKPVQVTQVAAVLNKVYGASQNLQEDIEESFPLQQKLMLCSLMLMLRNEKNKDITMGRLHEVYRRVCNKRHIHPLDQAEFAGTVDLVQTRGILRIIKKKEPRLHKVQLQWDEDEVNGALCDKQLIASILDDTACLAK